MIRITPLLAAVAILVGCASYSRQLLPLPDQDLELSNRARCRLYVARSGQWRGSPRDILVYDGESPVGVLEQETYLCWERDPGTTILRALFKDQKLAGGDCEGRLEIELEAGQVYYFDVSEDPETGRPAPLPIDEEEGRELIARRRSPDGR